jgi:hypothetical protein
MWRNRAVQWGVMTMVVLVVWLGGTWVTKYSLEQMAFYAPVAMVVVGATIGLVLLWVKIVTESLRNRHDRSER